MKTPHQVLTEARELISDPARWVQKAYALDARGNRVRGFHPNAVCWCSLGALQHVTNSILTPAAPETALYNAAIDLYGDDAGIAYVNDGAVGNPNTAHANVLAMFDHAIAATAP